MNVSVDSLVSEVRKHSAGLVKAAQAGSATDQSVKDPNNKGTATIPNHPDGDDKSKVGLPENGKNSDPGVPPHMDVTKPSPAGSNVPPVSKTEKQAAAELAAELRGLAAAPKAASAPVAAVATPAAAAAPAVVAAPKAAAAGEFHGDISFETFKKLAAVLLSTEEGAVLVKGAAARVIGEEQALALIKQAGEILSAEDQANEAAQAEAVKQASDNTFVQALGEALQFALVKSASEKRDEVWFKRAFDIHAANLNSIVGADENDTRMLKAAYVQGVEDGGAMVPEPGAAEAGALPGAESEIPPEQIIALIQQMVEAGELDPATAEALVAQLAGGAEGGGAPGGMPGEGAPGGGIPEDVPPEVKAAAEFIRVDLFAPEPAAAAK